MGIHIIGRTKDVIALRKLKDNKGLTLTELLCAIIVMLLVTGVMVVGIRLGTQAYVKSVSMSEAQQLCSTITTIVNDELRYTSTVYFKGSDVGIFSKNQGGSAGTDGLYFDQDLDGQVVLRDGADNTENKILTKKSYPYNLKAKVELNFKSSSSDSVTTGSFVTSDDGVFTATVTVYRTEGIDLATTTFQVRPLNTVTEHKLS